MKIGKSTVPRTSISTADADTIVVRGSDLCLELIGKIGFSEYFLLLLTGERPSAAAIRVIDATLVAIAEHGMVPSVQAARMTLAASPEALQGAVAAGILGCGSVILGASETAGRMFVEIDERARRGESVDAAAAAILRARLQEGGQIPGYGHPLHKARDPRVEALFAVSRDVNAGQRFVDIAEAVERAIPSIIGKALRLNVSGAIPAVLLGVAFPASALKGIPILARTASLIAHLNEEIAQPAGFALSYQAVREILFEGQLRRSP